MPESVKARAEEFAARSGHSLNTWLVNIVRAATRDNAINVDDYPKAGWQPDWFPAVVVVGWFLYTAVGIAGYRLYEQGRYQQANVGLIIYGFLVSSSLGHFLYGSPSELSTHGVISVFVDVAAGATVIAVAVWSILARRAPQPQSATE